MIVHNRTRFVQAAGDGQAKVATESVDNHRAAHIGNVEEVDANVSIDLKMKVFIVMIPLFMVH